MKMTRKVTPHTAPKEAGYMLERIQQSPVYLAATGNLKRKSHIVSQCFCIATFDRQTGKVTDIHITDDEMAAFRRKKKRYPNKKAGRKKGIDDSIEVEVLSCGLDGCSVHPESGTVRRESSVNPRRFIV